MSAKISFFLFRFLKEEPITCKGVFGFETGKYMSLDYIFYKTCNGAKLEIENLTVGPYGSITDHSCLFTTISI